ncbi:D-alanyl-D-alanine carboxypeptidase family protein [Akkermansia muciniphila]|uniref:D-alanyl-D-alanine carboxypeptidase n=1 Tax=Akkermansia muciniphila TaxID=239935 RepID=A0A2N8HGA7_9BACT|nr:D-alanyl-D-alanine carboxypeptidase family protein [Akkermansia muciniphila]PNC04861.1 D-alanyl-D-alanine carboxypeptidase [Akkermansia muciniphila]PNC19773.1 D-alanyl-D-alanine carboxypeptidase [Akkermansia muciniphila]
MRLFALLAGFTLCLSSTSCQSYGDSSDYIPLATPVPPQLSQPVAHALPRPANFPTRPVAIPPSAPRTPRCASACVMDALTGKVLFSHNGLQHRQVASTQKLVTAMVVLEHGSLDRKVVIQPSDTKADPTKLGFRAGEVYSRRELLNALMVRSFNDVAVALARDTAGSVPRFAQLMNAKARQMGMYNSRFVNPNGLPADQYSTAIDMARCAYYVYRNPELRSIICKRQYAFTRANGKTLLLRNTNKLLSQHSWVTGMKTGYTNAAGRCLVSSAGFNGRHVIVVVLGCHPSRIWTESENLLKWALGDAA